MKYFKTLNDCYTKPSEIKRYYYDMLVKEAQKSSFVIEYGITSYNIFNFTFTIKTEKHNYEFTNKNFYYDGKCTRANWNTLGQRVNIDCVPLYDYILEHEIYD